MERADEPVDSAVLLEAEIEQLMRRLADVDPNVVMRLEKLLYKFRIEVATEKSLH